VESRAIVYFIE